MPTTPTSKDKPTKAATKGSNQEFYQKAMWKRYSKRYKVGNPLCEISKAMGKVVPSNVTDHIIPMSQGGAAWDERNHMSLSNKVHNIKRGMEANGLLMAYIDTDQGRVPLNRSAIIDHIAKHIKSKQINVDGSRG